jgi:hypothetical protein
MTTWEIADGRWRLLGYNDTADSGASVPRRADGDQRPAQPQQA